jgi:hypothetical protein
MAGRCNRFRWCSVGWLMQRFHTSTPLRVGKTTSTNLRELFKHLPRLIAESGLVAAGRQRLPQHISQKTHRDVCAHAMFSVVPY